MTLLPGTLYTALDRLHAQGLVEPHHEEIVDGRLRRYYRLSASGATVLRAEAARMRELAVSAESRLGGSQVRANPGMA